MPRLPRITRQHAAALLLRNPDSTLLALDDGHLAVLDAGEFINRGRGRIILTGSELLDAGAELPAPAPGASPMAADRSWTRS